MTPDLWANTQGLPGLDDPVPVNMKTVQKKADKAAKKAYAKAMKNDDGKDGKVCGVM